MSENVGPLEDKGAKDPPPPISCRYSDIGGVKPPQQLSSKGTTRNFEVKSNQPAVMTNLTQHVDALQMEDYVNEENAVIKTSPCGRWEKRQKQFSMSEFPCMPGANLAMDTEEGIEVVWIEIVIDEEGYKEIDYIKALMDMLMKFKHPNLVSFHDYWIEDSRVIIFITECLTCGSLSQFIKRSRMNKRTIPVPTWKRWSNQILLGIQYLHCQSPPFIISNLTSEHIFIQHNGLIKIALIHSLTQVDNLVAGAGGGMPTNTTTTTTNTATTTGGGSVTSMVNTDTFLRKNLRRSHILANVNCASSNSVSISNSANQLNIINHNKQKRHRRFHDIENRHHYKNSISNKNLNQHRGKSIVQHTQNTQQHKPEPFQDIKSFGLIALSMATLELFDRPPFNVNYAKGGALLPNNEAVRRFKEYFKEEWNLIFNCLRANANCCPSVQSLLLHRCLFEVPKLSLLAGHKFIQTHNNFNQQNKSVKKIDVGKLLEEKGLNLKKDLTLVNYYSSLEPEKVTKVLYSDLKIINLDQYIKEIGMGMYPITSVKKTCSNTMLTNTTKNRPSASMLDKNLNKNLNNLKNSNKKSEYVLDLVKARTPDSELELTNEHNNNNNVKMADYKYTPNKIKQMECSIIKSFNVQPKNTSPPVNNNAFESHSIVINFLLENNTFLHLSCGIDLQTDEPQKLAKDLLQENLICNEDCAMVEKLIDRAFKYSPRVVRFIKGLDPNMNFSSEELEKMFSKNLADVGFGRSIDQIRNSTQ